MKALTVALVSIALCAAAGAASPFKGGVLEPPRPAPDFTLRTAEGREFRLSQHRGAVVLLTFGHTACPDVCPTILAEFAQVKARLGAPRRQVLFVFVTVDPERDSPDRVRAYRRAFDATVIGLTGSAEQMEQVRHAYGVTAQADGGRHRRRLPRGPLRLRVRDRRRWPPALDVPLRDLGGRHDPRHHAADEELTCAIAHRSCPDASSWPCLLAPGQTYRVPFRTPAEFQFACSVHRAGEVGVAVVPAPAPGLARLRWRLADGWPPWPWP